MAFPFALRSLKSTASPPVLVVVEPEVALTSFEDLFNLRLSNLSLPAALASLTRLLKSNPTITYASFASLLGNLNLFSILPSNQKQEDVSEASHSFPLANFADEIAFERKEEQQEQAQRALDLGAAFLHSPPPLLALHLALGLPDALFTKNQQLVEEALEKLVGLMTDGSTGEKMKAAGRLPESVRMALGLEGKVPTGIEGWELVESLELVESVASRLKERFGQAQLSSSSLGNGSTSSILPLLNQTIRIQILTHYLVGRISSSSSYKLTSTSLDSYGRCLALAHLDALPCPPATSSSSFFTTHGSTYVAHLLVKATKILQLHGRGERKVSRKEEKKIVASMVARLATEKGDRDFDERLTRIESRSRSARVSSSSSGSPLSFSIESLLSNNSTSSSSSFGTPSLVTPPSTPRSLVNLRKDSSSTESLALELKSGSLVRGGKEVVGSWRGRMGWEKDASRLMNGWLKW